MNLISQILPLANVVLDMDASSKKRAFEQVGLLLENNAGIARSAVFDSLIARERLGSTGLGQGVAIPHGRIKGLKDPLAVFVRVTQAIQFEAPDNKPVGILVFLLVPEHANQHHLEILSELAQMLSDREFRERLSTLPTAEEVHQAFVRWAPVASAA
ncbi:PTS sugar transporter subunit IIA [Piscinibacterium candidicorallinum]|jgi:PTS system nitrogen regulatory IIA component|uniref:PTS sugar transporter subunit IIA n=1 Tax=Piscinibacterium candidicorallinum TaxID=1793872 RepID=A0ABV7H165_9BURK|nr:PTS sugar transporter subunit IIA [beta proteobacterium AAP99]